MQFMILARLTLEHSQAFIPELFAFAGPETQAAFWAQIAVIVFYEFVFANGAATGYRLICVLVQAIPINERRCQINKQSGIRRPDWVVGITAEPKLGHKEKCQRSEEQEDLHAAMGVYREHVNGASCLLCSLHA